MTQHIDTDSWHATSWLTRPASQQPHYANPAHLNRVYQQLRKVTGLVSENEIEKLKQEYAEAAKGKRFIVQAGDCAESFSECQLPIIQRKKWHLEWIRSFLMNRLNIPITMVGRIAGQYGKPRSQPYEQGPYGMIPIYRGDMINSNKKCLASRAADPDRLLQAYQYATQTAHHLQSLEQVTTPSLWETSPSTSFDRWQTYHTAHSNPAGLEHLHSPHRVYLSHECLHLGYEQCFTRTHHNSLPYNYSAHTLWLGERTRRVNEAHVEYLRGIQNPIGVKISAQSQPQEVIQLAQTLNPKNTPGRLCLILRMGKDQIAAALPPLIEAVHQAKISICWMTDPMHGNTRTSPSGYKTRDFSNIVHEAQLCRRILAEHDAILAGVHLELSSEKVSECIGGLYEPILQEHLHQHYTSLCDPRLNDLQSFDFFHQFLSSSPHTYDA
ncbi:MAG: 3-deoxy-7-phosphoheptulonate synthase [Zetaproteobacteria bacterium]|nr:3-deoxy-7-phosphoheptulonate synthase [Zetaproteobacteria bacterium]